MLLVALGPWLKLCICPMSQLSWLDVQIQPTCHGSHPGPRLNNSRWYSTVDEQRAIDAIKACEINDINGGDDVDDGVAIEPQPTRREVLKAVLTISKYIDELDDPLSCKIEGLLQSFNRQLCLNETKNIKDTDLTNFFRLK